MKNVKLTIEYDGTNYCGWQKQNNEKTIQEEIEKAIYEAVGEVVEVIGSSRTDAGVHARGMVANFKTNATIPFDKFKYAINDKLPDDISIIESEEVKDEFHARYDSKGKTYCYSIINRQQKIAIGRNYAYHFKWSLDVEKMQEAAEYLLGNHDFTSFRAAACQAKSPIRTLDKLDVIRSGEEIDFIVEARSFLHHQDRNMVGTLKMVGCGQLEPRDMLKILEAKDRRCSGPNAPACGLYLNKVVY